MDQGSCTDIQQKMWLDSRLIMYFKYYILYSEACTALFRQIKPFFSLQLKKKKISMLCFHPTLCTTVWWITKKINLKGMTFDHNFFLFILLFFFPLFLGGKRKGEENNQSRGQIHAFLFDHKKSLKYTVIFLFKTFCTFRNCCIRLVLFLWFNYFKIYNFTCTLVILVSWYLQWAIIDSAI